MEEYKGDYKIVKNKIFKGTPSDAKMVYYNCDITDFHLENSTTLQECLFISCHLKSMKIRKIKDLENLIRLTFLNCRIIELQIEESVIYNIRFFNSEVFDSLFEYSTLPGMIFSKNIPEELQKIFDELLEENRDKRRKKESSRPKELDYLSVHNTKFLFCQLNEMLIDNTVFTETKFKHCNINNLRIMEHVVLKRIDIRGSNFFGPVFEDCKFDKVKFSQEKFLIEWFSALLVPFVKIASFFLPHFPVKNDKKDIKKVINRVKSIIKKVLYKIKLGRFADLLSSTDFQDIDEYRQADFSKEYHFLWHIQDQDFISHFKRKHRILSAITFWTSNYMRSFGALFSFSFIFVWLFSLLYSTTWANLTEGQTVDYFYLSFKIFSNFGLYYNIAGNAAPDCITKIFVIGEIIIGYFSLGTLLSILIFPFTRRTSLPGSSKKKDDSQET